MLFSKAAFLAIVSAAAAEPVLIHMSAREIFGLLPRQGDGYSPTQTLCTGGGTTCQSACGPSFDQCPSNDGNIHCFDAGAKQTCCSNGGGRSCDAGYYCTHDAAGTTICCPAGSDLVACKALFPSAKGDLVSDPPASKVVSSTAAGGTGTVSGANPTGTGSLGASGGVSGAGSRTGTFTGGAPLATGPGGSSTNIAVAPAPTGLGGAVVAAVVAGAAIVAL